MIDLLKRFFITVVLGFIFYFGLTVALHHFFPISKDSSKPDYTFEIREGISYPLQNDFFQTIIRRNVHDSHVHFKIEDDPGGWVSTLYSILELKKSQNLIFTAEAHKLVASAAYELLINTTAFEVNKDAILVIHTGSYVMDIGLGRTLDIPIAFPEQLTDSNGSYFFMMLTDYMNNAKYLTKDQWLRFLVPKDIFIKGSVFCKQNANKQLFDGPKSCVLKGLDYPGGVKNNPE